MHKTPILTLALGALLLAPSLASAVHGSPYTATGIAVGPDGSVLDAEVRWTGWATQSFVVTLVDATGNVIVDHDTFPGLETWQGPVYYNTEFFQYHGWANPAVGGSAHFDIRGYQIIQINTGQLWMWYIGNYEDYTLELVVG